jgi:hypothetical protein
MHSILFLYSSHHRVPRGWSATRKLSCHRVRGSNLRKPSRHLDDNAVTGQIQISIKIHQNSAHHGNRNPAPFSAQEYRQFVFAPTRILVFISRAD